MPRYNVHTHLVAKKLALKYMYGEKRRWNNEKRNKRND